MKHLNWLMVYMSMGVFSNTIVLLLYPAVGLICLLRIIQRKTIKHLLKKCGIFFLFFIVFTLLMVKFHMNISSEGKPLYTGRAQNFFSSVVEGYTRMFTNNNTLAFILALLALICGAVAILFLRKDFSKQDLPMMLVIFIATNILMQLIMHKGYIATRVLLPFYSFIVLCFYDLFSSVIKKLKCIETEKGAAIVKVLLCILCVLLIVSNLTQTNLKSTKDWRGDYKFSTWVIAEQLTGEQFERKNWNAAEEFYKNKYQIIQDQYLSDVSNAAK